MNSMKNTLFDILMTTMNRILSTSDHRHDHQKRDTEHNRDCPKPCPCSRSSGDNIRSIMDATLTQSSLNNPL